MCNFLAFSISFNLLFANTIFCQGWKKSDLQFQFYLMPFGNLTSVTEHERAEKVNWSSSTHLESNKCQPSLFWHLSNYNQHNEYLFFKIIIYGCKWRKNLKIMKIGFWYCGQNIYLMISISNTVLSVKIFIWKLLLIKSAILSGNGNLWEIYAVISCANWIADSRQWLPPCLKPKIFWVQPIFLSQKVHCVLIHLNFDRIINLQDPRPHSLTDTIQC